MFSELELLASFLFGVLLFYRLLLFLKLRRVYFETITVLLPPFLMKSEHFERPRSKYHRHCLELVFAALFCLSFLPLTIESVLALRSLVRSWFLGCLGWFFVVFGLRVLCPVEHGVER